MTTIALIIALIFGASAGVAVGVWRRIVVYDGREALLYRGGRFVRTLKAGTHYVVGMTTHAQHVDVREATLTVTGQELLTADQLTLKVSAVLRYQVVNVEQALRVAQNY